MKCNNLDANIESSPPSDHFHIYLQILSNNPQEVLESGNYSIFATISATF